MAEKIKRPINVSRYFKKARKFVLKIARKIYLTSAVLDDWSTGQYPDGKEVIGARIVYGIDKVKYCGSTSESKCRSCSLYQNVGGADKLDKKSLFYKTLCKANRDQIAIFSTKQFYLNCKTFEQYQEDFIRWFVDKCFTIKSLKSEVDWVKGFRILILRKLSLKELKQEERYSKKHIIRSVIKRLKRKGDFQRAEIVKNYAVKVGLL